MVNAANEILETRGEILEFIIVIDYTIASRFTISCLPRVASGAFFLDLTSGYIVIGAHLIPLKSIHLPWRQPRSLPRLVPAS